MHPAVLHIASGQSFFSGGILIIVAIVVRSLHCGKWHKRISTIAIMFGLLLVIVSSTPFHVAITGGLLSGTVILFRRDLSHRRWLVVTVCVSWVLACSFELCWHMTPKLPTEIAAQHLPVVVLADSVTAGLGEGEAVTWPQLLQARDHVSVLDLSHVGETVATALKRAKQSPLPSQAVFILELGGNDILGTTSAAEFERSLDELLGYLATSERQIFMFELPLIPFHNNWGCIQRRIATKYRIHLIPKWQLASVFAGSESTLDSIHLSQLGHQRMLRVVTGVLRIEP